MKFSVYVIESEEGFRYTGMTQDLALRLQQHNNHSLSFWTKRGRNWRVVLSEEFETKAEASHRERWLKTGTGREYLREILESK